MTEGDVRRLVERLPEAAEAMHHGHPDFRVGKKIFATLWPAKNRANVRLSAAEAYALINTEPEIYTLVSDRQPCAWVGVNLAQAKASDVGELIEEAWRLVAPPEIVAQLDRLIHDAKS